MPSIRPTKISFTPVWYIRRAVIGEETFPVLPMPESLPAEKKRAALQEIIRYCAYDTESWI
jgi:hypothetical protein